MTDPVISDLDRLVASVQTVPSMDPNQTAANAPTVDPDPLAGMEQILEPFPPMVLDDNPDADITEEEADTLQKIVVSYLTELDSVVKKADAENVNHCSLCVRD